MIKDFHRWIIARIKRAIVDYGMIKDGDRVAIGLSGGKDSTALLYALSYIHRSAPVKFTLHGIFIDMGWPVEINILREFCEELDVSFYYKSTDIGNIVFRIRNEKSPCSLCSNLRRGALNSTALELGCNKVALGHHLDDVIDTFFMSLFYTGQFRTFAPVTYLDRTELFMIRPLIYLYQDHIKRLIEMYALPVLKNACPVSGITKRQKIKQVVDDLVKIYPDFRERFLHALQTADIQNLWPSIAILKKR